MNRCPWDYYKLTIPGENKKCVKVCPAGYQPEESTKQCDKCKAVKCPRGMPMLQINRSFS